MTQPSALEMTQPTAIKKVSFKEFELYHQSAELVTDRRLAMNRWNYSVMAATLAAVALLLKWSTDEPSHVFVGVCGIVILCAMSVTLCTYWINQISDYKSLNSAKFKVLNEMAPMLDFDGSQVESYKPFEREWNELQRTNALVSVSAGRISRLQVLSASKAEYFIPKAFRVLFVFILVGVVSLAVLEHRTTFKHMNPFGSVGVSKAPGK